MENKNNSYLIKIGRPFRVIVALVGLTAGLSSCEHEDYLIPKPNENIRPAADFIKNNYDFRLLYAALEYTDLVDELNGPGPFTVLAVNDAGFNAVGIHTVEDIRELDRDSLKQILQYHVLKDRRLLVSDIPTDAVDVRYETLAGDDLFTSAATRSKEYYFDGAKVSRSDVALSNGVLHGLSKMMKYHKGKTVQDFLAANADYSIFVAGLKTFGLWDELAGDGPFTVFAPKNDAFEEKGITIGIINNLDTDGYNQRLFTAYIMYDRHYFVSDKQVFYIISDEYTYQYFLRDDDWYLNFGTESVWPQWTLYPTLTLFKSVPGRSYGDRIGEVRPNDAKAGPANFDHRFENGIVHDLPGLLITPEQALNQ